MQASKSAEAQIAFVLDQAENFVAAMKRGSIRTWVCGNVPKASGRF